MNIEIRNNTFISPIFLDNKQIHTMRASAFKQDFSCAAQKWLKLIQLY